MAGRRIRLGRSITNNRWILRSDATPHDHRDLPFGPDVDRRDRSRGGATGWQTAPPPTPQADPIMTEEMMARLVKRTLASKLDGVLNRRVAGSIRPQ